MASATMLAWVAAMIRAHLVDPVRVRVASAAARLRLEHALIRVEQAAKLFVLGQVLRWSHGVIVFGRTKHRVCRLARDLRQVPSLRRHRKLSGRVLAVIGAQGK